MQWIDLHHFDGGRYAFSVQPAAMTAEILVPLYLLMRVVVARMFLAFSICAIAVSARASNDAEYRQRLAALVNQYRVSHGFRP
jgi:hypothetical protein